MKRPNVNQQNTKSKKNILHSNEACLSQAKAVIGPPIVEPESCAEDDSIKVHRVDGVVQTIEVLCKCGERIMIRCDYE